MEAECLAGVVGEEEVGGGCFPECVEVSGFEVDAGAFDLEVDESVGPEVSADGEGVLLEEESGGVVVEGGVVGGVVAEVDAQLGAQGAAEEWEVGVNGVFGGPEGDGHLEGVGGVLEELLEVEVEGSCMESEEEGGLEEPEGLLPLVYGKEGVDPQVAPDVAGGGVEVDDVLMFEVQAVALDG